MKGKHTALFLVLGLIFLLTSGVARAEIPQRDMKMAAQVFERLVAVASPIEGFAWPAKLELKEDPSINAYATADVKEGSLPSPRVVVTSALLEKVVEGDADRLAYVAGHELAHITLGHLRQTGEQTPFVAAAATRDMEYAADLKGMEYAMASGYSFTRAVKSIRKLIAMGMEYSSFHGLSVDHPSWKDRLARLDAEQSSLWKAMSSFENGVVLLTVEQNGLAANCFRRVKKEFPSCFEAWSNLGYALLMDYCDALDTDNLKRFDVGHIVCGGFYRRAGTLEPPMRGENEDLWWEAVGALREALRLNPDSTLTKANLGLAYLVRPGGKDVANATRFLQEAVDALEKDVSIDPIAKAAVYINAGVAGLADKKGAVCAGLLAKAEENIKAFAEQSHRSPESVGITAALLYNRSLLQASSDRMEDRKAAAADMAKYLAMASPSSMWWSVGYAHYTDLCRQLGLPAKGEGELRSSRQPLRPVLGVEVAQGITVSLLDPTKEVRERLGQGQAVSVIGGTNLQKIQYPERGIELLVNEQVLAISLKGKNAPSLPLRASGLGGKTSLLNVGMAQQDLEEILGNEDYDFRQLDDPQVHYRFYRALGVAVRVKQRVVQELVVVQIPERRM